MKKPTGRKNGQAGRKNAQEQKYELVSVERLSPHPQNPRRGNVKLIQESIDLYGFYGAVVAQKSTGRIIAGNHRYKAALESGITEVPVVWVDVSDEDALRMMVMDNRSSDVATYDETALAAIIKELSETETGTGGLGFSERDIAKILPEITRVNEDDVPPVPKTPITKPGDLWLLGDHRLLCGDSTKPEDVARLMDGVKAEMMFTDPPYGVDYSGGIQFKKDGTVQKNNRQKLANDDTTDIYGKFLPVALRFVDGPCYMWFAGSNGLPVYQAVHDCGGIVSALLIWHKTNATYAAMNAQYKLRHETCLYFKPKGSTLRWVGPSDASTLWEFKRDGQNEFHPTQKPIALAANAMKNHKAATVLDVFAGSGSTIMAAEQLGRRCYAMEIDPGYCDVSVARWENLTGRKAELAPAGG